jgi:hypothetical protein
VRARQRRFSNNAIPRRSNRPSILAEAAGLTSSLKKFAAAQAFKRVKEQKSKN